MYVFSVTAKNRKAIEGFKQDSTVPFIGYIDFKDLFGAEKLCQLYIMQEGFYDVKIEKRQLIDPAKLDMTSDSNMLKMVKSAQEGGYAIQLFSAH